MSSLARGSLAGSAVAVSPPTLQTLTCPGGAIIENSPAGTVVGVVVGRTPGSTLTLTDSAGSRLALSGSNLVIGATNTDYEAAPTRTVTIREALSGALGTPKDSVIVIPVTDVVEAPANTVAPAITGSAVVGQTLTGSDGTWTGAPTLTRQWKRNGVAIVGETGSTYLVPQLAALDAITFSVTGTNGAGVATATSAATAAVKMAYNSRGGALGDSITDQTASKGVRNYFAWIIHKLAGKARPAVGADQGVASQTMSQIAARIVDVTAQALDFCLEHSAHNDGFNISGGQTLANLQTLKRAIYEPILINSPGTVLYALTTIPSGVSSEDAALLASLNAWILGPLTTEYRATYGNKFQSIDISSTYVAATMNSNDGTRTHPTVIGALHICDDVIAVVDPHFATGTTFYASAPAPAEQLETDWLMLAGTAGTKTGTVGGTVATGWNVTNNLTTATVDASLVDHGYYKSQRVVIAGTPGAENTVVIKDQSVGISGSVVAGEWLEAIVHLKLNDGAGGHPVGIRNLSFTLGNFGGTGTSAADGLAIDDIPIAIDGLFRTFPKAIWTAQSSVSNEPDVTLRHGTVNNAVTADADLWIVRRTDLVAYALPYLLNNPLKVSGNYLPGIVAGTYSNGQTIVGRPGGWSGGGFFVPGHPEWGISYQWRKNGADIAGANSISWVASGLTAGDSLTLKITATNSKGTANFETAAVIAT
jgi:hypothetical protein